jgi:NAD(P)-dependent dehydrogenase (short-subunit alcohol dehydrogenase family)
VPIELVRDLADADGREAADSLVLAREMHGCLDRLPAEQRETLWIQRSRLQEEPSLDETVLGGQREGSLDDLTAQGQGATSMPARWTTADIPDQTGRTLLITGANAGIGYHQARELAAKGATVLLASRDLERGRAARDRIVAIAPGARVEVVALDLADLDSVQRLADQVLIRDEGLDVLVNNAGVMGVPDRQTTAQGIELQFGTNHLGHFALTGRLLPALLHRPGSRVVTVSSVMHRLGRLDLGDLNSQRRYRRWQAYNNSKLANALFGLELGRRLRAAGAGTASVGAHPGYSRTGLQVTGPRLGGGNVPADAVEFLTRLFGQSAAQGALPVLRAATDPEVAGGDFLGPDGLGGARGWPVKVQYARRACDQQTAGRLWAISEQLTGVSFPALVGGR